MRVPSSPASPKKVAAEAWAETYGFESSLARRENRPETPLGVGTPPSIARVSRFSSASRPAAPRTSKVRRVAWETQRASCASKPKPWEAALSTARYTSRSPVRNRSAAWAVAAARAAVNAMSATTPIRKTGTFPRTRPDRDRPLSRVPLKVRPGSTGVLGNVPVLRIPVLYCGSRFQRCCPSRGGSREGYRPFALTNKGNMLENNMIFFGATHRFCCRAKRLVRFYILHHLHSPPRNDDR